MTHHLKHMAIAGGVALALLLAFGVDLSRALPYAIALACPVGMIVMMFLMNRHGSRSTDPSTAHHGHAQPPTELSPENHERLS